MVKVFIDVVSGDEMISDGYPIKELYDGAAFEVQGHLVTKGQEDFGIAENVEEGEAAPADPSEPPKGETVIDIVDKFDLKETSHDAKSFPAYIKSIYKRGVKSNSIPQHREGLPR